VKQLLQYKSEYLKQKIRIDNQPNFTCNAK